MDHTLTQDDKGFRCTVCERRWKESPASDCPGAKIYQWKPWPEGMFTRKQLAAKKLNPGPLAGVIPYDKSADGDGWLRLYRESEATPKPPLSPKRQAALEKMQAAAEAARHCSQCGRHLWGAKELRWQLCHECQIQLQVERDRLAAARKAYELICEGDFIVWDSETTDLDGKFIEIAVVNQYGKVLFDQRIRPGELIAPGAYDVHGIRDEELAGCPSFLDIYPDLRRVLHAQRWLIYNVAFDTMVLYRAINDTPYRAWFEASPIRARQEICVMNLYAEFYGDWHDYYKDYRWQKLADAAEAFGVQIDLPAHSALGDSLRTLEVLYAMADWYRKETL